MMVKKRILSLLLVICMLLALMPAGVLAQSEIKQLTAVEIPGASRLEKPQESEPKYAQDELVDGDLRLNKATHSLTKGGKLIELTGKEFDLLRLLMENKGKALSKKKEPPGGPYAASFFSAGSRLGDPGVQHLADDPLHGSRGGRLIDLILVQEPSDDVQNVHALLDAVPDELAGLVEVYDLPGTALPVIRGYRNIFTTDFHQYKVLLQFHPFSPLRNLSPCDRWQAAPHSCWSC